MASLKQIIHLCMNSMRRWAVSPRHYVLAVLAALWIRELVGPVLRFSQAVDVRVTPWVFPFTEGFWYFPVVTMLLVVLLFCDAPFINPSTPYESIRSGRMRWILAQLAYVWVASLMFVLFWVLVSVVCLLPHIDFSNEWGRVFNTLAQTNAGSGDGIIPISYAVIFRYSPLAAMGLAALLLYLQTVFVGLAMFAINLVAKRIGGVVAGFLLAFIPGVAQLVYVPTVYYFAPTAWANLNVLDMTGRSGRPSVAYALGVLVGLIALLTAVVLLVHRKKEIEVLMPV
jgi:hypothetical protein